MKCCHTFALTISRDSHQNLRLHTGARVNVVLLTVTKIDNIWPESVCIQSQICFLIRQWHRDIEQGSTEGWETHGNLTDHNLKLHWDTALWPVRIHIDLVAFFCRSSWKNSFQTNANHFFEDCWLILKLEAGRQHIQVIHYYINICSPYITII